MDLTSTFSNLGISLGLGLLVGLQREQVATQLAGLRTFALITVLGTICSLLATHFGGWVIAAGFLALTGALLIGHITELKSQHPEVGITTEVAALAMFGVGAYLVIGYREAAIAAGGGIAVLLHFKGELHGIAARLGEDSRSIMQFALLSMVILPALPDRTYGPYSVLNPRLIWLMVVLIVGIGLAGYIAYKFFGERVSLLLAALLGGMISSTATTASYARQSRQQEQSVVPAAAVILLASAVSSILALVEIAIVAPRFLATSTGPIGAMILILCLSSLPAWIQARASKTNGMPRHGNPTELTGALCFAVAYAIILLAIAAVKDTFGARGLLLLAAASGLVEVHALTLSTAQLVEAGRLGGDEGWRAILIALVSSLVFKAATAVVLGHPALWRRVALPYLVTIAVGASTVLFWS